MGVLSTLPGEILAEILSSLTFRPHNRILSVAPPSCHIAAPDLFGYPTMTA